MARVLLNHVSDHPAEREPLSSPLAGDVEGRRSGGQRPGVVALGLPGTEGFGHVSGGHVAERDLRVQARGVDPDHVLPGEQGTEPVALDLGHVPDQAEQRQRGWRSAVPTAPVIPASSHRRSTSASSAAAPRATASGSE